MAMTPAEFEAKVKAAVEDFQRGGGDDSTNGLITKVALVVEGNAKRRTPVKTGMLRRSVTNRVEGNVAYVGSSVEYAVYVHEGTRYMAGRPFLTEGLDDSMSQIEQITSDFGAKVLRKMT